MAAQQSQYFWEFQAETTERCKVSMGRILEETTHAQDILHAALTRRFGLTLRDSRPLTRAGF